MKTISRTIGLLLCLGGFLLGAFAIAALSSTPDDPTGAGQQYDQSVEAYNDQVKKLSKDNPILPAPQPGKTRLQAHRDDVIFWLLVAVLVFAAGLAILLKQRSASVKAASQ
jgi:hypothetical protein